MFKNITLELSLKPFKKTDDDYIRSICASIFEQWRPLLKNRSTVSVMLWVGDGSELLDYAGDLDAEFEWCRFIGTANLADLGKDEPKHTSLHEKRQNYVPNPPKMTYRILKKIIQTLHEEGKKAFPCSEIRVGETFDIGPEFAISDFKYNRHTEICTGTRLDKLGFVDATALLNADGRAYAAYPNGIPEGEPFGRFLGKQSSIFLKDMGFDYLWLSNGLGFSADPWDKTGKIFDGEKYYPERLKDTKSKVFDFWKLFREGCPDFPLETRGTNNSVGIDYASDGVPLHDLYTADLNITPPPNSPWAALNDNFGLEMMGHMTRICSLPGNVFPFRYYIHDPWWVNSPWYDRYDGSPYDIYLPMAISRITEDGKIESANSLNILSIDNSYGTMPDSCANEPIPHLLKAEKNAPDEPAPLVWVYPMREYTTSDSASLLEEMNMGDNYICDAINNGLPLCSVISTDIFLMQKRELFAKSILISPIPETSEVAERLSELCSEGLPLIIYGTRARLDKLSGFENAHLLDISESTDKFLEALKKYGFNIRFIKKDPSAKPPTMAISRYDGALLFSVYNSNTTTDVDFSFPMGAPVLIGAETEVIGGMTRYRFSRGEQKECRIFVEQKSGILSCREKPPVNARYRRSIGLNGLKDATVRLFPEKGCEASVSTNLYNDITPEFSRLFPEKGCEASVSTNLYNDITPEFSSEFIEKYDERFGRYLEIRQVSGNINFLIGHKNTADIKNS